MKNTWWCNQIASSCPRSSFSGFEHFPLDGQVSWIDFAIYTFHNCSVSSPTHSQLLSPTQWHILFQLRLGRMIEAPGSATHTQPPKLSCRHREPLKHIFVKLFFRTNVRLTVIRINESLSPLKPSSSSSLEPSKTKWCASTPDIVTTGTGPSRSKG